MADIYEAIRSSPLWEQICFIVTYDEHGGFFDHVPTPLAFVPNPDGMISSEDPTFIFRRSGVRVPSVAVSAWTPQGSVFSKPTLNEMPCLYSQFEHSSIAATLKRRFNLPKYLTERQAWASSFNDLIVQLDQPRDNCPTQLPRPGPKSMQKAWRAAEQTPVTDETIEAALARHGDAVVPSDPLSDLQFEILAIASGLTPHLPPFDIRSLKTEFEGALYVRRQLAAFFASSD